MKASCPLSSPQRLFPSPRSGEDPSQSSLKGRGLEVSKEACPRFPSPRRGGGRGGECKLTSQSFNCFTPPLTPPLKREGKGPLNAVSLFTPPLTPPLKREGKGPLNAVSLFTPPLAPPLKREGKGPLNAVSLFTPPLTPPLKREGKGSCKGGERKLQGRGKDAQNRLFPHPFGAVISSPL